MKDYNKKLGDWKIRGKECCPLVIPLSPEKPGLRGLIFLIGRRGVFFVVINAKSVYFLFLTCLLELLIKKYWNFITETNEN